MRRKEAEVCGARFDEHTCQLPKGHKWAGGKHHDSGVDHEKSVSWTDAGKERVLRERAATTLAVKETGK